VNSMVPSEVARRAHAKYSHDIRFAGSHWHRQWSLDAVLPGSDVDGLGGRTLLEDLASRSSRDPGNIVRLRMDMSLVAARLDRRARLLWQTILEGLESDLPLTRYWAPLQLGNSKTMDATVAGIRRAMTQLGYGPGRRTKRTNGGYLLPDGRRNDAGTYRRWRWRRLYSRAGFYWWCRGEK
jgi:hypothetical protein